MAKHFGSDVSTSAIKSIMDFRRTDAKLMVKAMADGVDPLTIEIPCGLRCSEIFNPLLINAATRESSVIANGVSTFTF